MTNEIETVENLRLQLEIALNQLIAQIGTLTIEPSHQFPFGWRKAAKGRTVWRLLEEMITQNLEVRYQELGFSHFSPAQSEVGIEDFTCSIDLDPIIYVNIKSAIKGQKPGKDDISKARKLADFFEIDPQRILLIATFELNFLPNMRVQIDQCTVFPVMWLPDIYVNPSNNGNLQSSKYKLINHAVRRTGQEFLQILQQEIKKAQEKRQTRN